VWILQVSEEDIDCTEEDMGRTRKRSSLKAERRWW